MNLDAVFADPSHEDAQDRVDELIDAHGWPPVRDVLFSVLEDPDRTVAAWQLAELATVSRRTPTDR